ncbi:hypothetical protein NEMIN01_0192 [Nematocida minor]|uniref:uncharacterized protein n=1 Tax=Nematocida minor TaxID=1912983 RepID=UPI00221F3383|nr:uncharacterized protein NEMIN01_0088 [Nematocida minor]XP_051332094.1 uncharacterized protein NEMIN01_0192 [Nematocida minor]KAI5188824.1 hypothetical protein NEMIN01_0088 [Nematocida minor]KAI5188928.1 hypothetical protein NEMIN01_0192 [Nematocida minor]
MSFVLENDSVQDKQLCSAILHYMPIPYFSNNTWYLSLWKRVYSIRPQAEVLFLMHMKGVGLLSAWLYLRMHEHFLRAGCDSCAHAILVEGIKAQAHPIEELEEKVDYSVVKAHPLEKPTRIKIFGREWIHTTSYAHPEDLLRKEGANIAYMEYKIIQYIRRAKKKEDEETEKGLNEVSLLFGDVRSARKNTEAELEECPPKKEKKSFGAESADGAVENTANASQNIIAETTEESLIASEITGANSVYIPGEIESIHKSQLNLAAENAQEMHKEKLSEILAETSAQEQEDFFMDKTEVEEIQGHDGSRLSKAIDEDMAEGRNEVYEKQGITVESSLFGSPVVGSKLVIKEMLYIVKKQLGSRSFLATRIASLGDGNVTLNAKDYALRTVQNASEYAVSRALELSGCTVPIETAIKYSDKIIVLSPYKEMGSLDRAISLMVEKAGHLSEILAAHYIKEILQIGMRLESYGHSITKCLVRDFVLVVENGRISLKLADYKHTETEKSFSVYSASIFAHIMQSMKIESTQTLLTQVLAPKAWAEKIERYLSQKRETSQLQSLFITQEVSIYEESHLV